MNWYYVDAGQQAGPVDQAQFEALVQSGRITPETLVWREGMQNWQPYRDIMAPASLRTAAQPPVSTASQTSAAPIGSTSEAVCAECGRIFNKQDMIQYGTVHVCAACKPVFMQKLSEGAQINTGELRYAGFWIRVGAKIVDGLILGAVFLVPIFYLSFKAAASGNTNEFGTLQIIQIILQLVYIIANMAYTIFFLGRYGATPGKMLCKIQVVTGEGGTISYGRATGRFFAEMLSGIVCYIGYIIVAFDDQKRGLHDHICNTRVVYK